MKKIILSISFLFFIQVIVFAQKSATNKKADEILELTDYVTLYLEDEDYYGAFPLLVKLDSLEPKNPRHSYQAGICLLSTNRQLQAVKYIQKAQSMNIKDKDLLFYSARINHLTNKFDEAIQLYQDYFKTINKSNPDYETKKYEIDNYIKQCKTGIQLVSNPLDIKIENIGAPISTKYPEYVPLLSGDEKTLIFTGRQPNTTGGKIDDLDGNYYEDVYISKFENGKWSEPQSVSNKINTKYHDACVGFADNGKTMILYKPDIKAKTDLAGNLYKSELINNEWTSPTKFEAPINSKSWEPSATLSGNDSIMIFSSNRPGGFGGLDLYMSTKMSNGKWGEAINLGNTVNTAEDEDAPFLHSNNKTLYFSSKGHETMGGYDIFLTELNPLTKKWNQPENIGYPLNSADHDIYFVWNKHSTKAYFSSFRNDSYGEKDIYTATRLVKDTNYVVLSGFVIDTITGNSLNASVAIIDLKTGKFVNTFMTDSITGQYSASLKKGRDYLVKVNSKNYFYKQDVVAINSQEGYFEIKKNFRLRKLQILNNNISVSFKNRLPQTLSKSDLKRLAKELRGSDTSSSYYNLKTQKSIFRLGDKLVFHNIFFDYNKTTIKPNSVLALEEAYTILKTYPEIKVEVSGYTDSIGRKKYNQKLSSKRAAVVVKYLVKRGIDKKRLVAIGEADNNPLSTNETEEGRQLNRRTEFKVISIDTALQDKSLPEFIVPIKPEVKETVHHVSKHTSLGVLAHFPFNSSLLTEYSKQKVEKVVQIMDEHPNIKVKIHAYSDPLGNHDYNIVLSEKRAEVILNYLISKGISKERLSIANEADMNPIVKSNDKKSNVLNRRVEFEVIE